MHLGKAILVCTGLGGVVAAAHLLHVDVHLGVWVIVAIVGTAALLRELVFDSPIPGEISYHSFSSFCAQEMGRRVFGVIVVSIGH